MSSITKRLSDILFIDIETAGQSVHYAGLTQDMRSLWATKARAIKRDPQLSEEEIDVLYSQKAGIYSEFAKVVCISVGYFVTKKKQILGFRVKSFSGHDEANILKSFSRLLKSHFDKPNKQALCGHNIKEFDIPFLCRRMVIHGMKVPKMLDIAGKKPWQVDHLIDTLNLWRFGDYKNYTSLALLSTILGIPSPKDDIDGSQIHDAYWNQNDLPRIMRYCEKDVFTTAKVFLRLMNVEPPDNLLMTSTT